MKHNVTVTSDHPINHDVDWVFGFHQYQYLVRTEEANSCSMSSPSDPGRNFSHLRKILLIFSWWGCLSLFKSFAMQTFLLSFMACDKSWPLLLLCQKYQMPSCSTCIIGNSVTPMSLTMVLIDSLGLPYKLLYLHNHQWIIQLFLNPLRHPQIDTETCRNHCIVASGRNAKQYSMAFPNFWRSELCLCAPFLIKPNWL